MKSAELGALLTPFIAMLFLTFALSSNIVTCEPFIAKINKTSFTRGDLVVITVSSTLEGASIAIEVRDPYGNIVYFDQEFVKGGSATFSFRISKKWPLGEYVVYIAGMKHLEKLKFIVAEEKPVLLLIVKENTATIGETLEIVCQLLPPRANVTVELQKSIDKVTWVTVSKSTTNEEGKAIFSIVLSDQGKGIVYLRCICRLNDQLLQSNITSITIAARLVTLQALVLDSHNSLLPGAKVIINGTSYIAKEGRLEIRLAIGRYLVEVYFKGVNVFTKNIVIEEKTKSITLKCDVFSLEVVCQDWLGNPVRGKAVMVESQNISLVKLTDREGRAVFEQLPKGTYIVKVGTRTSTVVLDRDRTITFRESPPWSLVVAAVALATIIIVVIRKYVRIEVRER